MVILKVVSSRRSNKELLFDILKVIQSESKPTRIMCRANLSWQAAQKSFSTLEKLKLISKEVIRKTPKKRWKKQPPVYALSSHPRTYSVIRYYITEKGKEVISAVKSLDSMLVR